MAPSKGVDNRLRVDEASRTATPIRIDIRCVISGLAFPERRPVRQRARRRLWDGQEMAKTWTLDELRAEYERYTREVNAADLRPSTKSTYLQHADRFVRWLAGDVRLPPVR